MSEVPSHVAGYTIMRSLRLGVFGADYLGHSNEGLRLVKVLREGEGLAVSEEAYAALEADAQLLHYEAGAALSQDQRVLTAHTVQAAAFGVLVGGSPLQNECLETTREFDMDQKVASTLRGTTLVQKAQLLLQVAQVVERLHKAKQAFPYITPWNVILEADQARLVEVGLGFRPDDPKFDLARVPEDVLVYLAPEVQRALAEKTVVQVSPAADVYALAATARSILLNRVADPAAPAGAKDAAASRRELALKGGGLKLEPHQLFSRELEALLRSALSLDPARRPSAAQVAARLHELVQAGKVTYTPPPVWPTYAAIGAGVVAALLLVAMVIIGMRPPPDRVASRRAYAAASRLTDPVAREEALRAATVTGDDGVAKIIPEARRLLAITRYVRWARSQKDAPPTTPPATPQATTSPGGQGQDAPATPAPAGELVEILAALDRDVVAGHDDALAQTARFIAATLRRWELGGAAREAADKELDALARADVRPEALRDLAAAARALTATGQERQPTPDELARWSEAANSASADAGFLAQPYPAHGEADGYDSDPEVLDRPVAVGLDSAWLGRLIAGRIQALLGRHEDARSKFASARDVTTFATQAAYGLQLAATATRPEDLALARKLLEGATSRRGPFAEALLAQGRIELRQAYAAPAEQRAAGFARAVEALQGATGAPADTPGLDVAGAALALELEARFYEATSLATAPEQGDEALRKLDALQRRAQEALPAFLDAHGPDLSLARGLVRVNRGEPATADLLVVFKNSDVGQGRAELPALEPVPASRAAAMEKALQAIAADLLARAEALPDAPKREEVAAAEKAIADLTNLVALPEAKGALDLARVHLARAKVALGKFLTSDGTTAQTALETAKQAYQEALDLAKATNPEAWIAAIKGRVGVAFTQLQKLGASASLEQSLPVLRQAKKDLEDAGKGVPRAVQRLWDQFHPAQRLAVRTQYLDRVEAWTEERKQEWNTIDIASPRYPEDVAGQELATLQEALALFQVEGRYDVQDGPTRFRVASLLRYASLLDRARRLNPKVHEHATAALELCDTVDAQSEPRVEPLRERLNFTLGWVALNEGASLAGLVSDPKAFGYDALSRAAGARDFADLKARVASREGFTARSPDAVRAIASDIVATYESGPQAVPPDPKPGTEIRGARDIMSKMDFATRIDARNAGAFLVLARVQFSMGPEQYESAFRNAQRAYELAGAAGPQGLAVLVQASRLYCFARSQMPGSDEAVGGPEFRAIATRGRDAARELLTRDQGALNASYNYGPAYWVAKSFYVKGMQLRAQSKKPEAIAELEGAVRAYDEFERLIQGRDAPAESTQADFKREKANANNLLRVLRQ